MVVQLTLSVDDSHLYTMPSAALPPVIFIVVDPELQNDAVAGAIVPAVTVPHSGKMTSSAPITGVVPLRPVPSISVVIPLIGCADTSGALAPTTCKCRSVFE